MKYVLITLLFFVLPIYAQTPPPNVLNVDTIQANKSITTPSLTLGGTGGTKVSLPNTVPSPNDLLSVQSVTKTTTGVVAQTQWIHAYNGKLRISASCTITVVNGIIPVNGVVGCH